ncbi:MAG: FAD binding domain-containing protein [Burkholderiales bacterium]
MKPAPFEFARPEHLDEALAILALRGHEGKVIAGGQSLVPVMNLRLAAPRLLIDLNRIRELAGVQRESDSLHIGAMTRQAALMRDALIAAHAPLIAKALPHIGHLQTRARGTIGGSLAHADPAAELPLAMVALDAQFVLRSATAARTVAARAFFQNAMSTALTDGELLTDIFVPVAPHNARCDFRELARRHGDFAIVAVAAQYAAGKLSVAVGGLEPVPRYCRTLIDALGRASFVRSDLPAQIEAELKHAKPLADLHASAEYRRHLAAVLLAESLEEVLPR